jgi:hypothetical protein
MNTPASPPTDADSILATAIRKVELSMVRTLVPLYGFTPEEATALLGLTRSAPEPRGERELDQAMKERDEAEEWADKLADAVATFLGADFGEHSSGNFPWQNAIEALDRPVTVDGEPISPAVARSLSRFWARIAELPSPTKVEK